MNISAIEVDYFLAENIQETEDLYSEGYHVKVIQTGITGTLR